MVDDLFKVREPMPKMDAIYFITPTKESIEAFEKEEENHYANLHLFFSSSVPSHLLNSLKTSKFAKLQKIKTMKEIHFEFYGYEERIFHFDDADSVKKLFGPKQNEKEIYLESLSKKLASVFVTLQQFPIIRFQNSSKTSKTIASHLLKNLNEYNNEYSFNVSFFFF